MVLLQPFALVLCFILVAGVLGLPVDSLVGHALSMLGQNAVAALADLSDVLQLPITVPIYLARGHEPFSSVQSAASHDRIVWCASLIAWVAILRPLLAKPRQSRR